MAPATAPGTERVRIARRLGEVARGLPAALGRATSGVTDQTSRLVDLPWPLRLADRRLLRPDGSAIAVLECSDLDVTALDVERQVAVVAAMGQLCRTLREPLQIVVQLRRRSAEPLPPTAHGDADIRRALIDAEARHAATLLAADPSYARRLFAVCSVAAAPAGALDRVADQVRSALAGAGIETRRLDGAELVQLLEEAWGSAPALPHAPGPSPRAANTQKLAPPSWIAAAGHLRCGRLFLRGLRLHRLPGTAVEPGWLAPLLRVRTACDVAIHLHPATVPEAMTRLDRRLRQLRADQLAHIDRETLGDAAVEAGVDAAMALRDRLARNVAHPLWLSVTAVVRAGEESELTPGTETLRTAFNSTLAGCEATHFEHVGAAVSVWPLGADRSPRRKLVDSAAVATCVPFVEAACDDPGGYLLGRAALSDAPVRLAPFDTRVHTNANVAVLAASGRGKSYALGMLVLAAAARDISSVVVDPEGEHAGLIRALGGEVLELRPGCGSALNIFECGDVAAGASDRAAEVTGAVVALVEVLVGGLTEVERAHVDAAAQAAIVHARAEARVPVLGDCVAPLRTATPRVATVLDRFCTGPIGELFNRPTSIRLGAEVVGVSLRDLRDELIPAATLVVAEWLWALVRRDRRERHLVFDEVGLLCAHAPLRSLLAQLARRCRKYGASLVIATQNAGDLLSSEEGRVMATNPAIVLLGGHRGAETMRMEQAYALTPRQRASLEGAARGEFLLLAGSRRVPIRIEASPLHHSLLVADAEVGNRD
jgi:hypothetical protein